MEIRAALGISTRAYSSWAKLFGFRQCDLLPGQPRAGAPQKLPPGPGGYARSGRVFRGLPATAEDGRRVYGEDHAAWTGGAGASRERYNILRDGRKRTALDEVMGMQDARQVLEAVREAVAAGERDQADRLVAAWATRKRRDKALAGLERDAAQDEAARAETMSDETLAQEVSALLGRRIKFPT
ncbi:MAG: hypothetical protein ABJH52_08970 [Henriciella sp.]